MSGLSWKTGKLCGSTAGRRWLSGSHGDGDARSHERQAHRWHRTSIWGCQPRHFSLSCS